METGKLAEDPKIYKEFVGKIERNGVKRKYWIQDLLEEHIDEVVDNYVNGFGIDALLFKYSKAHQNRACMQEFAEVWRLLLGKKMSLVCLTKNDQGQTKIAGFNCLYPCFKGDSNIKLKDPLASAIMDFYMYYTYKIDPYETYDVDKYLASLGLYVLPEFRGEAIGQHLLRTRADIGKRFGFSVSLTIYSSFISQKEAGRVGFKDHFVQSYADAAKVRKDFNFPGIEEHTKEAKMMVLLF